MFVMHHSQVVLVVHALGPHHLLLDECKDIYIFQEQHGSSDVQTASGHAGISNECIGSPVGKMSGF